MSKPIYKRTEKKTAKVVLNKIPKVLLLAAELHPDIQKRVDRIKKWQRRDHSSKVVKKMIDKAMEALKDNDIE